MKAFPIKVGDTASFSKTVSESDVYLFAGITGDFTANHVNQAYMERSRFGKRQAHGALLVGFMSTVAGMIATRTAHDADELPLSLGYDRIRFIAPVFLGDTVTVDYRIVATDPQKRRATAEIEVRNQDGTLVSVATHILAWVANDRR